MILTGLFCGLSGAAQAQDQTQQDLTRQDQARIQTLGKSRYISVENGVAMGGFDPVSFFLAEHPQAGSPDHAVMWKGAVWLFVSRQNRLHFEANPRAFAPRYGGHCAYGIARGKVVSGDPARWEIVDGRLYLFHTDRAADLWLEDPTTMLREARAHCPAIMRDR